MQNIFQKMTIFSIREVKSKMKIAVLGGSFNPLHIGHAMLGDTAVKELGYDKVLFVPAFIPPHKRINDGFSPEQRLEHVHLFCQREGNGHFAAEDCEINRKGISYSVDTIKFIAEKYKDVIDGKPGVIMGEEVAAEFCHWKRPDEIAKLADFIIVPRRQDIVSRELSSSRNSPAGYFKADFESSFNADEFGYDYTMIKYPVVSVSSTEIRTRIACGRSYRYLVPHSVFEYIEKTIAEGKYNGLGKTDRAD